MGGEPFPSRKLFLKASHPQNMTRLFNIYGITEISCWSSISEIAKNTQLDESCLGEILSETIFEIRNEDNKITTDEGILYIGKYLIQFNFKIVFMENILKNIYRILILT